MKRSIASGFVLLAFACAVCDANAPQGLIRAQVRACACVPDSSHSARRLPVCLAYLPS